MMSNSTVDYSLRKMLETFGETFAIRIKVKVV